MRSGKSDYNKPTGSRPVPPGTLSLQKVDKYLPSDLYSGLMGTVIIPSICMRKHSLFPHTSPLIQPVNHPLVITMPGIPAALENCIESPKGDFHEAEQFRWNQIGQSGSVQIFLNNLGGTPRVEINPWINKIQACEDKPKKPKIPKKPNCKSKNRELVDFCFQHKSELGKIGKLAICKKFLGKRRRRMKEKRGTKRRKRGERPKESKRRTKKRKTGEVRQRRRSRKKGKSGVNRKAAAYPPWYGRCNRAVPVNSHRKNQNCGGSHTLKHPLMFIIYEEVVEKHLTEGRGEENWCCFKILQSRNECSLECDNQANKNQLLTQL